MITSFFTYSPVCSDDGWSRKLMSNHRNNRTEISAVRLKSPALFINEHMSFCTDSFKEHCWHTMFWCILQTEKFKSNEPRCKVVYNYSMMPAWQHCSWMLFRRTTAADTPGQPVPVSYWRCCCCCPPHLRVPFSPLSRLVKRLYRRVIWLWETGERTPGEEFTTRWTENNFPAEQNDTLSTR